MSEAPSIQKQRQPVSLETDRRDNLVELNGIGISELLDQDARPSFDIDLDAHDEVMAGIDDFMSKPLGVMTLLEQIRSFFN